MHDLSLLASLCITATGRPALASMRTSEHMRRAMRHPYHAVSHVSGKGRGVVIPRVTCLEGGRGTDYNPHHGVGS